jgi:hypothetical protein
MVAKATETCRWILIYYKAYFISVHLLFYYRYGTYEGVWDLGEPHTQFIGLKMCRYSFMLQSHIVSESSDSTLWYFCGEWWWEPVCHGQQCQITWRKILIWIRITWLSQMNCHMLTCALLVMFPRYHTLLEGSLHQEVSNLLQYPWHKCFTWTSIIYIS